MSVNLVKGQKINLSKQDGSSLSRVSLGMNWGAIVKKGVMGFGAKTIPVDLDASCAVFDNDNKVIDIISFRNLRNSWISHSGDDRSGDEDGDDGQDNETISVDLSKAPSNAAHVVFFLNSFQGQDFADIPYAAIRVYEGASRTISNTDPAVIGKYDVATESKYAGHVSMVMGRLYRRNEGWNFQSIGEPTKDRRLEETVETIRRSYLAG